jgi:hypothetical protein
MLKKQRKKRKKQRKKRKILSKNPKKQRKNAQPFLERKAKRQQGVCVFDS